MYVFLVAGKNVSIQIENLKELENIIAREFDKTIGTRGSQTNDYIRDYIREKTEELVYDFYDPVKYERRKERGGLVDPANLIEESKMLSPSSTKIDFVQIAKADSTKWEHYDNLSGALNDGYNEQEAPWEKARGHIDYMNERLAMEIGNDIIELLKFDLSAKGYKVR